MDSRIARVYNRQRHHRCQSRSGSAPQPVRLQGSRTTHRLNCGNWRTLRIRTSSAAVPSAWPPENTRSSLKSSAQPCRAVKPAVPWSRYWSRQTSSPPSLLTTSPPGDCSRHGRTVSKSRANSYWWVATTCLAPQHIHPSPPSSNRVDETGHAGVRLLLDIMNGRMAGDTRLVLDTHLVVRLRQHPKAGNNKDRPLSLQQPNVVRCCTRRLDRQ